MPSGVLITLLLGLVGGAAALTAAPTRTPPPIDLTRHTLLSRRRHHGGAARALPPIAMAAFASFEAFEAEVRAYLATLDDEALHDPDAPSPLGYVELKANGRVDLAEGCLQYGGYLAVSKQLGVRLQKRAPPPPSSLPTFGGNEAEEGAKMTLGFSGKEEKMAADLARLQTSATATATATAAEEEQLSSRGSVAYAARSDERPTPPPRGSAASAGADGRTAAAGATDGADGVARYARLNGLQRANVLLLVFALGAGFGRTAQQVLDPSIVHTAQTAGLVLGVAHVVVAAYAAFAASTSPRAEDENAALWFFKCLVSGPGGLLELRQRLDA